ncbi:MAG TPA: aldo/keto reductase [Candidatus Saccharimonadales bacterium]|nr:aldo/keto reductase [Candidatus Saccharimonadales bacterium]
MATMTNSKPSALSAGYVKIGHYRINRLGFGAMRVTGEGIWGPPRDPMEARRVLKRAVQLDVNFIDTADAYGPAVSEQLIHDTLHPYEGLLIATKGGYTRSGPGRWQLDGSPEHLRQALDDSCRRLGVDQITLYQFHHPDPRVDFETSVQTLVDLKEEGRIRHIGLSNVSLLQLKTALTMTEIVSVQNYYNVTHRRESDPIVDFCEAHGIVFIPYYPVGGGMNDFSQRTLLSIAEAHQATPQQIALAWLLARSPIMLPIPGTSSVRHLEENVAATGIELTDDDLRRLQTLSD